MHLSIPRGIAVTVSLVIFCAVFRVASARQIVSSGDSPATTQATATKRLPSEQSLYRGLFSIVAHMERARLANPPNQMGEVVAAEESLRNKIDLSKPDWQMLLTTAVKVDAYTEKIAEQANVYAHQRRTESAHSTNGAQIMSSVRVELRKMQTDEDDRVHQDIKELEAKVGANSASKIHVYLHGPLADSAQVTPLRLRGKVAQ